MAEAINAMKERKSKIENGIKLQEQLMKKSMREKIEAKKKKPVKTQNVKPRTSKTEQNLDLKWLKKDPKKKR